jgi:hypothetical protein
MAQSNINWSELGHGVAYQNASIEPLMLRPWAASLWACRKSGRCQAYLLTRTRATIASVGSPP